MIQENRNILKPIDIKNISELYSKDFEEIRNSKNESEIFSLVKSARKEQLYGVVPFKPDDYKTYSNLVINKPKIEIKPTKTLSVSNVSEGEIKERLGIKSTSEKLLSAQKAVTTKAASTFMGVLDAIEKPVRKGINLAEYGSDLIANYGAAVTRAAFTEKTLGEEFKRASDRVKDSELKRRLFLGVLPGVKPNLNSIEENRRILLEGLNPEERKNAEKYVEENKWWFLANDVATGVATGLGTSGAIKGLIKQAPKSMPLLTKSLKTFDDVVNPSMNNMARLGAFFGLSAASYYGATGEWIFKDDKQAETGAIVSFLPLGLKALGLGANITKEAATKLLDDPSFNKGLENFLDGFAKKTGAKMGIIEDGMKEVPDNVIVPVKRISAEAIEELPQAIKNNDIEAANKFLSSTAAPKKSGWEDKIRREGMWKEGDTLTSNVGNYFAGKLYSIYANNFPNQIGRLFKGNERVVINEIKGDNIKGLLNNINKEMSDIATNLGDDISEFNKYIFAKSRSIKASNVSARNAQMTEQVNILKDRLKYLTNEADIAATNKEINQLTDKLIKSSELKTRANGVTLTKGALDAVVDGIEGTAKGQIYREYSERLSKMNSVVLNYMRESGLLSQKQVEDLISSNPYYVQDKLLDDITEQFFVNPNIRQGSGKIKALKSGTDELDFEVDKVFDNMYDYYTSKLIAANKNAKRKLALELSETYKGEGARVIREGDLIKPEKGEVSQTVYIDGELKNIAINKQWNDFIEEASTSKRADGIVGMLSAIAQFPTKAVKTLATGALSPFHSIMMLGPEFVNGVMYAKSQGIPMNKYITSWLGSIGNVFGVNINPNSFISNPKLKKAMEEIAGITGADFSYQKAIRQELRDGIIEPVKRKGAIRKMWDWSGDLGHKIEMRSLRLPIIEAGLKDAGITKKQFAEWAEDASRRGVSISQLLKENGVDYKRIGGVARDVFNYADASNFLKSVGRFIPYANIAAVNAEMMRRMLTSNPKAAMGIIGAGFAMSQAMYSYNYSGDKGEELRKQDDFISHQSGFYFGDGSIFRVRNIPILEWIYPLVVEMNEGIKNDVRDFDISDAFAKMTKDLTFAIDLNGSPVQNLGNITPTGYKQAVEVAMNKDFFYDKELISEYNKKNFKGNELLLTNDRVKPYYNLAARVLAVATGGREDENGIIQGGYQISPINLQKLFSFTDPANYRTMKTIKDAYLGGDLAVKSLMEDEGFNEKSVDALKKLVIKQYKIKDGVSEIYDFKNNSNNVLDSYIKQELKKVILNGTREEAMELAEKYNKDGKYTDYIKKNIQDRAFKSEYGAEGLLIKQMSTRELIEYYDKIKSDEKMLNIFKRVMPTFSPKKQREVFEAITQKKPERN